MEKMNPLPQQKKEDNTQDLVVKNWFGLTKNSSVSIVQFLDISLYFV